MLAIPERLVSNVRPSSIHPETDADVHLASSTLMFTLIPSLSSSSSLIQTYFILLPYFPPLLAVSSEAHSETTVSIVMYFNVYWSTNSSRQALWDIILCCTILSHTLFIPHCKTLISFKNEMGLAISQRKIWKFFSLIHRWSEVSRTARRNHTSREKLKEIIFLCIKYTCSFYAIATYSSRRAVTSVFHTSFMRYYLLRDIKVIRPGLWRRTGSSGGYKPLQPESGPFMLCPVVKSLLCIVYLHEHFEIYFYVSNKTLYYQGEGLLLALMLSLK